ncbi:two-component system nitrogen regulation sensor histidine kinase GlnL [Stella humosa]|uniref:histidine kinase n=1 Tax=Stella humosa TaxID=94 RepID=A0A3N1M6X9_9PROT|nr:ATP-binding protein [Stella humosa]ROQ01572.1 two-component system nitrogen regulation sensor histidine kinase GlnL [Stella humosa]BBK31952.1 PAS domain-containing sensor histidine kinase [Stella humosa]
MGRRAIAWARRTARPEVDAAAVLATLADPVLVVDQQLAIRFANPAAEQFFDMGLPTMIGRRLDSLLPPDSPACALVEKVRDQGGRMVDHGVAIDTPRTGAQLVSVQVAPLGDGLPLYVVALQPRSIVERIDHQLTHRGAARSVSAMAAMLAHEVKNPLSGIRGAAQLLEQNANEADRELTRLICDETDRICALVDRMEVFSDSRPIHRGAVNIHEVLEHVRRLAESGFARGIRFVELYDPSLPPVLGNRDMLVQVLLNLVKNAAEAVPEQGGEIVLSTAYQHGVRLAVAGSDSRLHLPLVVTVQDNGSGVPEDLRANLFDPFVTTKHGGKGLGLALVAKIIDDHGGLIEFDSQQRRTTFRVKLPMVEQGEGN